MVVRKAGGGVGGQLPGNMGLAWFEGKLTYRKDQILKNIVSFIIVVSLQDLI